MFLFKVLDLLSIQYCIFLKSISNTSATRVPYIIFNIVYMAIFNNNKTTCYIGIVYFIFNTHEHYLSCRQINCLMKLL